MRFYKAALTPLGYGLVSQDGSQAPASGRPKAGRPCGCSGPKTAERAAVRMSPSARPITPRSGIASTRKA